MTQPLLEPMYLPMEGREYWTPVFQDAPTGATIVAAKVNGSWFSMPLVNGQRRLLVAGPEVNVTESPNPAGTVTLGPGVTTPLVKFVAGDEVIIRPAGTIQVGG